MFTRPLRGWFHWQAQQADKREKVIEEQQHALAGGLEEGDEEVGVRVRGVRISTVVLGLSVVVLLVLLVLLALLVLLPVASGHWKSRSRKGSEAEGEQTWRTRSTTWPGYTTLSSTIPRERKNTDRGSRCWN